MQIASVKDRSIVVAFQIPFQNVQLSSISLGYHVSRVKASMTAHELRGPTLPSSIYFHYESFER